MALPRRLTSLLRTLFRREDLDRDLDAELQGYLDHEIGRHIAAGVSPQEARCRVLAEEGGLELVK
jgi:hypothetical protein